MVGWGKTRINYISRSSEGKYWHVVSEKDGIMVIDVYSSKKNEHNLRQIKRVDYENKECYPLRIPLYTMLKVFD